MDAIDTFLDAMFAPYPATPRLLEAKAELRTMMEDAYSDAISRGRTHNEAVGQVITDFGNLEELAPTLGILPDLRSAQAGGAGAVPGSVPGAGSVPGPGAPGVPQGALGVPQGAPADPGGYPVVTLSEAQALAQARRSTSRLLAWGVAVIIMSPCPLILLASLADDHAGPADDVTSLAGLVLTLLGIVVGVLLLLRRRQAFVGLGLEHLIDGRFTQSQEVSAWASRLRADNEGPRSRALMVAVGLFMLSPVPTVVAAVLGSRYDHSIYLAVGVCLTLAFVATGLLVLLPVSWASSTYETLTEEGQPTTTAGRSNALVGAVAAVYWPLVTAVFLVWGFLGYWDICWIIWPVAGVLFGAVAALVSLVSGGSGSYYRRQRDWR